MALKFDLSEIGRGATINSATFRFYKHGNYSGYSTASTHTIHALTTDWSEGSTNWTSPWSTAGGDFNQTAIDSYQYNGSYTGWIEYTVTDAIQSMVDGTIDNCGLIIADLNGDDGSSTTLDQELYIFSKEVSDESKRPQLVVDYDITEIITSLSGLKTLNIKNLKVTGNKVMFEAPAARTISLSLYSVTGRLIMHAVDMKLKAGLNTINLATPLSKGMYLFKFHNDKGSDVFKYLSLNP